MSYYSDHPITARVKIMRGASSGPDWYLRIRSSLNNYGAWIDTGCCIGISKTLSGVYKVINQIDYSLRYDTRFIIKVEVIDNQLSVYINGRFISGTVDEGISSGGPYIGYPYIDLPPGSEIYIDYISIINLKQ
jgi:hypothetical protein